MVRPLGAAHRTRHAPMDQAVRAQSPRDVQVCSRLLNRRFGIFFSRFERSRSSSIRDLISTSVERGSTPNSEYKSLFVLSGGVDNLSISLLTTSSKSKIVQRLNILGVELNCFLK